MAQATQRSKPRSRRSSSGSSRSTSRNGSTSRASRSRNGTSRTTKSTARATRTKTRARTTSPNGPVAKTGEKVAELASKARPRPASVRKTRQTVGRVASKVKTPLVAGGAALAGLAGGLALKSRVDSRKPLPRLRRSGLSKSAKKIDLSKVDLDAITSAARRVRSFGEQVGDLADAADRTRKKHK